MDCEKGKTNVAQIFLLWLLVKGYRLFLAVVWQSWVKFQKQETGKVIKREGVTKDVPTWFDLPQTFFKTDERHRKCQPNSFRVTSLCKLHCCLKFQDDYWVIALYMVSHTRTINLSHPLKVSSPGFQAWIFMHVSSIKMEFWAKSSQRQAKNSWNDYSTHYEILFTFQGETQN